MCESTLNPFNLFQGLGKFVDKVRIYARGGTGGQGSSQLGGLGGDGGDVCVRAVEGSSLNDLARRESRRFIAGVGGSASRSRSSGRKGNNVVIAVPPGTVVYDHEEREMVLPCSSQLYMLLYIIYTRFTTWSNVGCRKC